MWIMPKGVSRQLAQHKLLFKSRMGKNVEGDMVRFQVSMEPSSVQCSVCISIVNNNIYKIYNYNKTDITDKNEHSTVISCFDERIKTSYFFFQLR